MKYFVLLLMFIAPLVNARTCAEAEAACNQAHPTTGCVIFDNPDRVSYINQQTGQYDTFETCSNCPAAGTKQSQGFYDLGTNPDLPLPTQGCDGGCATSYTGDGITKRVMIGGVYHYFFGSGGYYHSGQTCSTGQPSPSSGQVPSNSCNPTTQDTGQVNGVTVCLDKPQPDTSTKTTTPPTTDPATGNTTTTTSNTTNNTTNNTTTTTTTTTTSPDGTQTTSSQTTTNPTDPAKAAADKSFCQANPTDPSCNAPTDTCKKNPDLVGCHNLGTPTPMDAIPTNVLPVDATVTAVGNGGMCPAPANLSFMGSAITWSYQPLCDFSAMIRPLVIGFAWLSFGLIVAAGVKK